MKNLIKAFKEEKILHFTDNYILNEFLKTFIFAKRKNFVHCFADFWWSFGVIFMDYIFIYFNLVFNECIILLKIYCLDQSPLILKRYELIGKVLHSHRI